MLFIIIKSHVMVFLVRTYTNEPQSRERARSSRRASLVRDVLVTQLPLILSGHLHANPPSLLSLFICLHVCNQLTSNISIVGCRLHIYLLQHPDGVLPLAVASPTAEGGPFRRFRL